MSYKSLAIYGKRGGVEKSIYRYIIRYSRPQQITLTVLAVASYPFFFWFLQMPKAVINHINKAAAQGGASFAVDVKLYGLSLFELESLDYL